MNMLHLDDNTISAAKALLGSAIFRRTNDNFFSGIITETEAYLGTKDLACHSAKGKTKRTVPMFGPPGTIYVYLIYGMYFCLNIVTQKEGVPEAVLIRGVNLIEPYHKELDGPGKICRELSITNELSGSMLGKETGLWIKKSNPIPDSQILVGPRVGIKAPEPWATMSLRFKLNINPE